MNKIGNSDIVWLISAAIIIALIVCLVDTYTNYEDSKEEVDSLKLEVNSLYNNITRSNINTEICKNKLSVVIQDRYKSMNYNEAVCEEFC